MVFQFRLRLVALHTQGLEIIQPVRQAKTGKSLYGHDVVDVGVFHLLAAYPATLGIALQGVLAQVELFVSCFPGNGMSIHPQNRRDIFPSPART